MARRKSPVWTPSTLDYSEVLIDQNPWSHTGQVPEVWAREVERPLAKCLWRRMQLDQPRRYELVLGPRRVGKTTSLYQTVRHLLAAGVPAKNLWWLRLDHPLLMRLPLKELVEMTISFASATAESPVYLFLDELTYAKDWDLWLKTFYDETWPVRLAGSSSSTAALRDRKLESGVGRWEEQYLAPYLFLEFLSLVGDAREVPVAGTFYETLAACIAGPVNLAGLAKRRRRFMLTGGFPELLIGDSGKVEKQDDASALLQSQRTLRNDAVERAIYKDIPQAFGVDNPMLLERLLYTLAGQATGILSPNSICKSLDGMSQPTFDRYLSYLEKAFLVFTLPNYSGSEASVQKRGRKLYFVDGAVRNAALQRGLAPLKDDKETGLLLENVSAGHLHALSQQTQVRLYHWRDKDDEVDLVYDHPESPMAFEIATSAGHHRRGLYSFVSRYPRFQGRCFVVAPDCQPALPRPGTMDEVGSIPLDLFLLAASGQAEKELEKNLLACPGQA